MCLMRGGIFWLNERAAAGNEVLMGRWDCHRMGWMRDEPLTWKGDYADGLYFGRVSDGFCAELGA